MYGVWWSGAEPDVLPAGDGAKGYNALALHPAGSVYEVHKDIFKHVFDKGKSQAKREDIGHVLYNRGILNSMLTIEAIRTAQDKFGKKPMTGEQVRWGFENLNITAARIKEMGMEGLIAPVKLSCADHEGARRARIHQWDGKQWVYTTEWIEADTKYLRPKMEAAAKAYAAEKKIEARDCGKVAS
jgi:branched-chain amino acid transport system substrate-binding protein